MLEINDEDFEQEVLKSDVPCLVDFWAEWCGPCKMFAPVLEELTKEYEGRVKFAKLNVEQNPITASRYKIQNIPNVLIFKDGKIVNQIIGAQPKEKVQKIVEEICLT